jgi:nucleotide-binding universal stress UspA family protein
MYRTILVPLDGSAFSERALPMAIELARPMGAQLVLVRAASAPALPGDYATDAQVRAVREAETYLVDAALKLAGQSIRTETAVPYGAASEAILLEVGLRHADLVIMCTHGRSGLGRWIYGSVAEGVVAHSPVPVLLVRPTGSQAVLACEPLISQLLVPLDGSALSEAALPQAATLARSLDCRIQLLSVVVPPRVVIADLAYVPDALGVSDEALQADRERANQYLAEVAERLQHDGLCVQTAVREGPAADTILQHAQTMGARLIVMATHGRTGVERLLLGSVALEVVHRTLFPVMLVHPTGQRSV